MSVTIKKKNFKFLLFHKFQIFESFFKPSLKNIVIGLCDQKLILFLVFVSPVLVYFHFQKSENYKKIFPLFDQTLPGSVLPYHKINWNTFQKIHNLPIIQNKHWLIKPKQNQLETKLFQLNTIQEVDYWGNFLTFEFTKEWDYYKKHYFFGIVNTPNTKNLFSARDNIKSRFYSCIVNNQKTNPLNFFEKPFYTIDEFPLKLQTIDKNNSFEKKQEELHLKLCIVDSTRQKEPKIVSKYFIEHYGLFLNPLLSESGKNSIPRFVGIQNNCNRRSGELKTDSLRFETPPPGQNSYQRNLFLRKFILNNELENIRANIQNTFSKFGYILPMEKNFWTMSASKHALEHHAFKEKRWESMPAHQFLDILEQQLTIHPSKQLDSNHGLVHTRLKSRTDVPNIHEKTNFLTPGIDQLRNTTEIQNKYDTIDFWQTLCGIRKMSGFMYPDMTIREFQDFELRNTYYTKNPYLRIFKNTDIGSRVQLFFGDQFIFPTTYLDLKPNPVNLQLHYYPVTFENAKNQIKYIGAGVLPIETKELYKRFVGANSFEPTIAEKQDSFWTSLSSKALDTANWFEVQSNLEQILNKNDPHQATTKKFFQLFGVESEMQAVSLVSNKTSVVGEGDVVNELSLDEGQMGGPFLTFRQAQKAQFDAQYVNEKNSKSERDSGIYGLPILSKSSLVVPYLTTSMWQSWLINSENFPISTFPIRQIHSLKTTINDHSFDRIDYQLPIQTINSIFNPSAKNSKLIIHEFPINESSFSTEILRNYLTNISYLKSIKQYQAIEQNPKSRFLMQIENAFNTEVKKFTTKQTWEPMHQNSWLIVSQYLFALFLFSIFRQFTTSYGKELIAYLIMFISALGLVDDSVKEELTSDESKYRIIQDTQMGFDDIAGIAQIFPQLSELVWSLRSSKRMFRFLNSETKLPKGLLFIGPPGTGKTLLVKALAGEARVPIFLQPAGAFTSVASQGLGAQRLQRLFEKAKEMSPCILFFDEIDSLGQRRSHIIQNGGTETSLFGFVSTSIRPINLKPLSNPVKLNPKDSSKFLSGIIEDANRSEKSLSNNVVDSLFSEDSTPPGTQSNSDQLSLLIQLLIELDGLQSARNVLVIGATNRVDVLDPALIRPGRFDKILKLGLPQKAKRIQICQLYATRLGSDSQISWDYIGKKTLGLSGADLATIINQSTIESILKGNKHTTDTIDFAIDKVINIPSQHSIQQYFDKKTTLNSQSNSESSPKSSNTALIARFAYYQAGKTFITLIVPELETSISCSLNPQRPNSRYQKILTTFFAAQLRVSNGIKLKAQIMDLLGGKITEFLYFRKGFTCPSLHFGQSDFGSIDLIKASSLIYQIVDYWYVYCHHYSFEKVMSFSKTQNLVEFKDAKFLDFLSNLTEKIEKTPYRQGSSKLFNRQATNYHFQNWAGKASWQIQVSDQSLIDSNSNESNWYRIYMKNPTERIRNDEWIVPDVYYHNNQTFFLTKTIGLTACILQKRDLLYQELLNHCFDDAFTIFLNDLEFIDYLASLVIKYPRLRQFDIQDCYNQFTKRN